ncbi:MAG: MBL fold metallo-hydrolase [bacterium]|nr:MBL fold metallo-hydrolase [bacterium]
MSNLFTLEAVAAKEGDALLLHWGDPDDPYLAVIDGGPPGVYRRFLKPRLDELRASRGTPLPVDLMMLSHIDSDHIAGLIDLAKDIEKSERRGDDLPYDIFTLWQNTFDDIIGGPSPANSAALGALTSTAGLPADLHSAGAVVAGVRQGRILRDMSTRLGINVNEGDPLVEGGWTYAMDGDLDIHVIGPLRSQIDEFQEEWDAKLRREGWAQNPDPAAIASYTDKSAFNLASIVCVAEFEGKSMLLTGDARGDFVIEGLRASHLLTGSRVHFDILKVPHHGSDRNVTTEFFRTVTADHYVISGDGKHHNPDIPTLWMIQEARRGKDFTVHCTYRSGKEDLETRLDDFLGQLPAAERRKYRFRGDAERSLAIDLGKQLVV